MLRETDAPLIPQRPRRWLRAAPLIAVCVLSAAAAVYFTGVTFAGCGHARSATTGSAWPGGPLVLLAAGPPLLAAVVMALSCGAGVRGCLVRGRARERGVVWTKRGLVVAASAILLVAVPLVWGRIEAYDTTISEVLAVWWGSLPDWMATAGALGLVGLGAATYLLVLALITTPLD